MRHRRAIYVYRLVESAAFEVMSRSPKVDDQLYVKVYKTTVEISSNNDVARRPAV